jgi:polysaccharide biosynthesis/export protein
MNHPIFSRQTVRCIAAYAQIFAVLLLPVQPLSAQSSATQVSGGAQTVSDQCSGPLGTLMPECQAAKTSMDLNPATRPAAGMPTGSQVTISPSTGEETRPAGAPAAMQLIPPEPPSEFQRFVASSIGQVLPIFGASLFEKVPTTYAPLDRVPVTADYAIGPGDEILLRTWGQVTLDLRLPVDRAGAVFIPQVGNVPVSGMEFRQLPEYLRSQLGRVYRNFDLIVNMGQLRSIQVYVVGQARQPGTYTVSSLSTLVTVLFASGGPSARGSMRRIQLKRGAQVVTEIDLYNLLLKGDKSEDVRLLPEDVVYIPQAGPQVAAAGSLRNPAIYELKSEKSIGELIQMAGGLSSTADRKRATVERIKDGESREVLELSLGAEGMNLQVVDGDILQVLNILPRFDSTVTLRGNVANPGRFRWHAGMRLKDIIPDKDSLVTRDYWKQRNLLGNVPVDKEQFAPDSSEKKGQTLLETLSVSAAETEAAEKKAEEQRKVKATRIDLTSWDINWSYAAIERQDPQDLSTKLIPFDLGKLVLQNDERQNLELRSGDVVTIFSQRDIRVPQMQQTRLVRLEGEFNAPGVYNVNLGETLGQLIQKAGGLTPQAYLFGAEFLRESVRADQQKRLEKYRQDLEREIETTAATQLSNAAKADEAQAMTARIQSERQLVQKLQSVQATGRIVLNLKPGSNDITPIAGMTLEDQDRFLVPSKPATVSVLGSVYTPNAFMHAENRRTNDYLRQAGGPTRNADSSRAYIVQADGSVIPKQDLGSSFEKKKLNPGDSVVVPERILKPTFMSQFRDWTQILFQIGMTAATIAALQ